MPSVQHRVRARLQERFHQADLPHCPVSFDKLLPHSRRASLSDLSLDLSFGGLKAFVKVFFTLNALKI